MKLPIRILLIDGDAEERELTRRVLRDDVPRVEVVQVGGVDDWLDRRDDEPPLVVVSECDLGWSSGPELLLDARRRWPECRTVLFTSQSLDPLVSHGQALRCDAVLRKNPPGWNKLGLLVLTLVAQSREVALAARRVERASRRRARTVTTAAPVRADERADRIQASHEPARRSAEPAVTESSEDVGASTLDWFPDMDESGAEGIPRAREEPKGPVHQLLPAVDLESVILTAMSQLKRLVRSSRARVRAGPLPTLRLDRTDALALFRNLIANALEHSGEQPPVVTIHAERRPSYWLLVVHDNGPGIPAKDVGEALHLIHPPGVEDGDEDEGGLSTCAQVARRYGGALWVHPRGRGGTSVFVALCTTEAQSSEDVSVTVQYQGHDMGRISVSSLSNKQQIAGRALELPQLRSALRQRAIQDVVFVDDGVIKVVA